MRRRAADIATASPENIENQQERMRAEAHALKITAHNTVSAQTSQIAWTHPVDQKHLFASAVCRQHKMVVSQRAFEMKLQQVFGGLATSAHRRSDI